MTRRQKLNYINKEIPFLYEKLSKSVPLLLKKPNQASKKDIVKYNKIIFDYIFKFADFPLIQKLSF